MYPHFLVLLVLTYSLATRTGWATLLNKAKLRNVATLLNRAKLEFLSSIVFHTVLLLPLEQCGKLSMIDTPVLLY